MRRARPCLAWPEDGTALVPPMLPQPLALACGGSRAARGDPTGRGPSDIELRLASARPQVPSRPFTMLGSFSPASRTPHTFRGLRLIYPAPLLLLTVSPESPPS